MLISDYIVSFLIEKKITDVFGYPGGMVTYLMDSFYKKKDKIQAHLCYHEQGAAFAACGYAQVSGIPGVAYATSGPGATNLLTGIANAYFDSIPCIFITGQVNTYDIKKIPGIRQNGFQETDIVSMARPVTKYAVQITDPKIIRQELEKAFYISMDGRKGPVLLDIPMNIQRTEINPEQLVEYKKPFSEKIDYGKMAAIILQRLAEAKKPLLIVGAGIRISGVIDEFREFINLLKVPVVTSMIAVDVLPTDSLYNFGFLGAYGHRWANFATSKSDFVLTMGTRLDGRQTGADTSNFAKNADIMRVDIDVTEIEKKLKANGECIIGNLKELLKELIQQIKGKEYTQEVWLNTCRRLKQELINFDGEEENRKVYELSKLLPKDAIITTDVGQNQVWVAQSFVVKERQQILFSGGHGAMGYSLPAAIGAYYATKKKVFCFVGDGGLQMNIQELQVIARERLPIKVILLNNQSLGMIRHFQEMYFNSNYMQTVHDQGYTTPNFCKIANAYDIKAKRVIKLEDFDGELETNEPILFDVQCRDNTYVFPKLAINKPIYDQEPLIERKLFKKLKEFI